MKCAYCGNDITGTDFVQFDGMHFCNTIHRYSYKAEHNAANISASAAAVTNTSTSTSSTVWTIAGSGVGILLGLYSGIHVFVPFILVFGVVWVLNKTNTVPIEGRNIIGLLAGQFGWMFLGAVLTDQWQLVYIDLVFIGAGIIWLLVKIHAIPIILLLLFQLGVLFININLILMKEIGTDEHRALVVHIALRVMVIVALGSGVLALRKRKVA